MPTNIRKPYWFEKRPQRNRHETARTWRAQMTSNGRRDQYSYTNTRNDSKAYNPSDPPFPAG